MSNSKGDKERGKNTKHVGDAIQQLLQTYHLKSKFDEANLLGSWERLVGKPIARRTKKVFIRNKVLFVELDSPSMKQDISLHKQNILDVLKKEFGSEVVKEIVIM